MRRDESYRHPRLLAGFADPGSCRFRRSVLINRLRHGYFLNITTSSRVSILTERAPRFSLGATRRKRP